VPFRQRGEACRVDSILPHDTEKHFPINTLIG